MEEPLIDVPTLSINVPTVFPDASTRKWHHARNVLLGICQKKQNIAKGAELAAACTHKDAIWVTDLFNTYGIPVSAKKAGELFAFYTDTTEDPRALYFAGMYLQSIRRPTWTLYIERAAILDYAPALTQQVRMKHHSPMDKLVMVLRAAQQLEPTAWMILHNLLKQGRSVSGDPKKAIECLQYAAESGDTYAQYTLGLSPFHQLSPSNDAVRLGLFWLGIAAKEQETNNHAQRKFCYQSWKIMSRYLDNPNVASGELVFQIGDSSKGHLKSGQAFGFDIHSNPKPGRFYKSPFLQLELAVRMRDTFCDLTRLAIYAWCIVASRFGIFRDVRHIISVLIWDTRKKGLYILNKDCAVCVPKEYRLKKMYKQTLIQSNGTLGTN